MDPGHVALVRPEGSNGNQQDYRAVLVPIMSPHFPPHFPGADRAPTWRFPCWLDFGMGLTCAPYSKRTPH